MQVCDCDRERGEKTTLESFLKFGGVAASDHGRIGLQQLHRTHTSPGPAPMRMHSHFWLVAISFPDRLLTLLHLYVWYFISHCKQYTSVGTICSLDRHEFAQRSTALISTNR